MKADHFLYEEVGRRLLEHLEPMSVEPKSILNLYSKENHFESQFKATDSCSFLQLNELSPASFDFVISNAALFWCDDLESIVSRVAKLLKPHGLFMFSTLGPDTLKECEGDRLIHTPDMHDIADMLTQHQLLDPVSDMQTITFEYDTKEECLEEARELAFMDVQSVSELSLTFEVIFCHAWKSDKHTMQDGEVRIPISSIKKRQ